MFMVKLSRAIIHKLLFRPWRSILSVIADMCFGDVLF